MIHVVGYSFAPFSSQFYWLGLKSQITHVTKFPEGWHRTLVLTTTGLGSAEESHAARDFRAQPE